ncbi:isoprenoid synthase domain-containing protein [Mycena vulgaris]|nr:isoprenoid synthase domain-containing protein [Mycena vulgaris]
MSTVVCTFPPARDHIRAAEIRAATDSFFLDNWPFASQEERDLFVRCDFASFTSKFIPDGEFEKMILASRVNALLFLTDDQVEKQPGSGLSDRIAGIVRGEMVPRTGSSVEQLINRIFRGIEASTGDQQYTQFSRLTCECLRNQDTPVYQNISEYLDFRAFNSGGYFGMALARYALDIYLTDEELRNPLLAVCERLALEAIVMENDVASYEKEAQQNTLGNNLVAILLQHGVNGQTFKSPSAAKAYIRGQIADTEARLHDSISVALADGILGTSDVFRAWLRAIPYLVSGNTWWSQQTGRYNIPGKPVPRRVVHLEGVGDIICSEP